MNDHDDTMREDLARDELARSNGHAASDACAEYRLRVSSAHDGEPVEEGSWRRHALLCDACGAFERNLPRVAADLAVLRGTPVRDLWPALESEVSRARRSRIPTSVGLATAAAGALATWGLLGRLAPRSPREVRAPAGVERALAEIANESAGRVELARILDTPELRLLARLEAPKENDR